MWSSRFINIDRVTGFTFAAVLCTLSVQRSASRQSELYSEILSWILLPILFKLARRPTQNSEETSFISEARFTDSPSLWIVATSLVVSCWCQAESNMISMLPLLPPALLLTLKLLSLELPASSLHYSWLLSTSTWTTISIAVFCTLTLSGGHVGSILAAIAVSAQFIIYLAFMPRSTTSSRLIPYISNLEDAIVPISFRTLVCLAIYTGIHTFLYGFTGIEVVNTLLLGVSKALSWYFVAGTARYSSWCIAPAINTFSLLSTCNPSMQTSESQAVSTVVASFLALLQVFRLLPDQAKGRHSLWAFSLVFLIPYAANQWKIQNAQSLARLGSSIVSPHPVEVLAKTAKAKYHALLQRQSISYSAAHGEYRRRYGAEPPDGFEAWYEFAAFHQSPIIDDFDSIFDLLSPFWELSGDEVLERMRAAQATPNSELWRCNYSGDDSITHCSHPSRSDDRHLSLLFDTLLKGLPAKIASVTFLVNHLDEPRVLIPSRRSEARGNSTEQQFNMTDLSHQPTWDTLTKFCPYSTPYETQPTPFPLPFVTNPTAAKDLCQHPEYQEMHGLFLSPASLPLIQGLVPILSTGSLSTTSDILFPSPAYIEPQFQYEATHDIAWDKKRDNLYWAGSTTGAHASNDQWPFFHRQRFVALAQNLLRKNYTYTYLRNYNGVLARVHSAFLNTRLFDVAFTRISQCARRYCAAQDAYFRVKSWANKNRALHSKLVFDLDGNGISGRYYQLLASNSAPLKQTLLREWHDERLVPWVHYIPVSMGMEELPELVTHLTANEAGMRTARDVAEAGKEWFGKALREVDRSVYVYSLLLELARIQDPEREAGFPLEGRRESAR